MPKFQVTDNNSLEELLETNVDEEALLEKWLVGNLPKLSDEISNLLFIGSQVVTNLNSRIDLLALDKNGDIVCIELKKDTTPRDTIAQILEYASFIAGLEKKRLEEIFKAYQKNGQANLSSEFNQKFGYPFEKTIDINKDQKLIIIAKDFSNEILQIARYLINKGIKIFCIKYTFFESKNGAKVFDFEQMNMIMGLARRKSHRRRVSGGFSSGEIIDEEQFIRSLDENGRRVFTPFLDYINANHYSIHWGKKGFSLNINKDDKDIAICQGYPPNCNYGQSIITTLVTKGGMIKKTKNPEDSIGRLQIAALETKIFKKVGREYKCFINREFSDDEIESIISWCEKAREEIEKN